MLGVIMSIFTAHLLLLFYNKRKRKSSPCSSSSLSEAQSVICVAADKDEDETSADKTTRVSRIYNRRKRISITWETKQQAEKGTTTPQHSLFHRIR